MKTRSLFVISIAAFAGAFVPTGALAHHQLITVTTACTAGGWIATYTVTADADRPLTWTVNGAPSQPDETPFTFSFPMTLGDASHSFTANAVWSNGASDSDTATATQPTGCTVTTTTEASTTSLSPTTSVPATTTSTTASPTTTVPGSTSSTLPSSTTSEPPSTPTTTPASSLPPGPSSTTPVTSPPTTEPPAVCTPVLIDLNEDGDTLDPNENSCTTGRLPATGTSPLAIAVIAFVLFNIGLVLVTSGRRRWNQG